MPDLPTLTVTQPQMDVILEAFKDYYGTTTPEQTATAYKRHLAKMILEVVMNYQTATVAKQADITMKAKIAEVRAFFPDPNSIT